MSMESLHEESDKNASFFVLRGTESFSSSFDNLDSDVKVSKLQLESVKVETTNAEGVGRKLNYQLRLLITVAILNIWNGTINKHACAIPSELLS